MSADWYQSAIDDVARSARDLRDALQSWEEDLEEARRQRARGDPLIDMIRSSITKGSRDRRVAADEAMAAYRASVMRLRAAVVHNLVTKEGMTLTAVANLLRISRQMASRLYGAASAR